MVVDLISVLGSCYDMWKHNCIPFSQVSHSADHGNLEWWHGGVIGQRLEAALHSYRSSLRTLANPLVGFAWSIIEEMVDIMKGLCNGEPHESQNTVKILPVLRIWVSYSCGYLLCLENCSAVLFQQCFWNTAFYCFLLTWLQAWFVILVIQLKYL